ncbi:MAG: efflux RND transporter periplasmic adaptor subunit [Planctomycetes bacterium]|nr:efflux RND transporter periplasmic adaptor subunit [Planctomycetota bacterium]
MSTKAMKKGNAGLLKVLTTPGWNRVAVAGLLLVGVIVIVGLVSVLGGAGESQSDVPVVEVKSGPLVISVSEAGTVQSSERVVVKSEVEGRSTILSLIPEGTHVEPGDLLVELDSSNLVDRQGAQEITVLKAEASFISSRENLEVTKSQAASDVAKAELNDKFARIDLKKYVEGEYPQELQQAEADITLAKEEQKRAIDKLNWSKRLSGERYITKTELQADELATTRAEIMLKQAERDLSVFKEYTHPRTLAQLESDVEQAGMALERARRKAAADVVQVQADFKAKQSEYNRQKDNLDKLVEQIGKCKVKAPVAGMVVYATTGRGGWRGNQEPLEEGQEVRERQELVHLPTASAMMAEVKVQEASLRKITKGMPARITVDAFPGRAFTGHVTKIGLLPDAQSAWLNPDLKVYSTQIDLDGDAAGLRPGMSCRVEIIVEEYENATYVPVQCVLQVGGEYTVYVKGPDGDRPRRVEVGFDNNRVIRITSGLEPGEKVLLAPPLAPSQITDQVKVRREGRAESKKSPGGPREEAVEGSAPAPAGPEDAEALPEESGLDLQKLRNMTPEEQRKWRENLSEEDREKLRKMRGGRGGRGEHPARDGSSEASADRGARGGSAGTDDREKPQ